MSCRPSIIERPINSVPRIRSSIRAASDSTPDPIPPAGGLPLIRIAGYDAVGAPNWLPSGRTPVHTIQAAERFHATLGDHDIRAGGEFRHIATDSIVDGGFRGSFYFHSLEDFLLGRVGIGRIARGDTRRETTLNTAAWYVQDIARLARTLTLNLGLRWEYAGVLNEREGRLFAFLPDAGGLVSAGTSALPRIQQRDLNNFAPIPCPVRLS